MASPGGRNRSLRQEDAVGGGTLECLATAAMDGNADAIHRALDALGEVRTFGLRQADSVTLRHVEDAVGLEVLAANSLAGRAVSSRWNYPNLMTCVACSALRTRVLIACAC